MASEDAAGPLGPLEAFLSPVKPAHFLREFYCRAPLHMPGAADRFTHLLTWDELNKAITMQRKNRPQLRLAKDGKILPLHEFLMKETNQNGEMWRINFHAVQRLLQEGATLVIDRIDESHEPLADFCRMLEAELGTYAFADVFASWHHTQGFPTHWDPEQVFVLQLVGTKHWRVFKPKRLHPTQQDMKTHKESPPTQPYWEGDINPGALLYIPGGCWHDAVAVSARTLHVSLSLFPASGLAVLNAVLRDLQEDELVRMPLPRFAPEVEQQDYMARLRGAVDAKMREFTVKSLLEKTDAGAPARTRLSMPWSAVSENEAIPGHAWIHWLPPRQVATTEAGPEFTFKAIGAQFTFVAVALPVVRDLISRRKSLFSEICSRHPQLPVEDILLQLVCAGLVAIADDSVI
jgi:ribosomal protein L16 Arg81 hydroxylase